MRTVERMDEVREPVIVFSAHGVPPSFHDARAARGLEILDTTCKFVYDIHHESQRRPRRRRAPRLHRRPASTAR